MIQRLVESPTPLNILAKAVISGLQFFDFAHRMHDRRVIATAKFPADFWQGAGGELLGQIHGDLPGPGNSASAA